MTWLQLKFLYCHPFLYKAMRSCSGVKAKACYRRQKYTLLLKSTEKMAWITNKSRFDTN